MKDFSKEEILNISNRLFDAINHYQDMIPEDTDDPHRIFNYYIGHTFEGYSPDNLKVTDGGNENGMDFYIDTEDRFIAYQCKIPEFSTILKDKNIRSFNRDIIKDANDILKFLFDDDGKISGNQKVMEARTKYRQRKNSFEQINSNEKYIVEIGIAFFGKLTPNATDYLEELKNSKKEYEIKKEVKIIIKEINFLDIVRELDISLLKHDRPNKLRFSFQNGTLVRSGNWGYCLIPAIELHKVFDQYKMALFDLNVRYHYKNSSVNRKIMRTLLSSQGQKNFHLLNNGITIACNGWTNPRNGNFTVHHPQIINGCQTVVSLFKAYNQLNESHKQQYFADKCFVPVKLIETRNHQLLDEIVIATNNQNKMNARNLLSNTHVQRLIQNSFIRLKPQWFYQRKDEEFENLKIYRPSGFHPKNYGHRIIDNEELAKAWLSFIGLSSDASEKINAFELIEESGKYEWLFERIPLDEHWQSITLGTPVNLVENRFNNISPSAEQYLLSYLTYSFIRNYLITPPKNRQNAITRLKSANIIDQNTTVEEINKNLMNDDEYLINLILTNMKEVIVELYAYIFVKRYGPINRDTATTLLSMIGYKELMEEPNFKEYIEKIPGLSVNKKRDIILYTCFEFIKEVVVRWKSRNIDKYLAASRRIRLLHHKDTIKEMKEILDATNTDVISEYQWKKPEISFINSLPSLTK